MGQRPTVYMTDEEYSKVDAIADEQDVSFALIVRSAITAFDPERDGIIGGEVDADV